MVAEGEEGQELSGSEGTRREAIIALREIAGDRVSEGQLNLDHRIYVEDAEGQPVCTETVREVVAIEG